MRKSMFYSGNAHVNLALQQSVVITTITHTIYYIFGLMDECDCLLCAHASGLEHNVQWWS